MNGIIANYRQGVHTQYPKQMIIVVDGVNNKEDASKLIGKTATWKSPSGKEISGSIKKEHGNKGAVRVIFEKGLPGQAIGSPIEIN